MKLRPKGRRFDTIDDIHAETQEIIDTLAFENFQRCMKSWDTRLDRCIHAQGDYFEGRWWKLGVTVLWSNSPNFWVASHNVS